MDSQELLMMVWILAIALRLLGRKGKALLADAEAATAHCMARLYLSGQGEIWAHLSRDEWKHSAAIRPIAGKIPPLDRPQGPDFAPGYSRLACWKIWVGPPFHQCSPLGQLAIIGYFEDAQARFYLALAALSWGADRATYLAIAAQEQGHASQFPLICARCRRREGWAIAAMLLWDVPRILLGRFRHYGDSGK